MQTQREARAILEAVGKGREGRIVPGMIPATLYREAERAGYAVHWGNLPNAHSPITADDLKTIQITGRMLGMARVVVASSTTRR